MDLEQIYYIGELITAVTVIGSLLFVGMQMRQNTTALRAQSHHAFTEAINQANLAVAQSQELADLWGAGLMNRSSLTDVERGRVDNLLLVYFHALDTLHYQTKIGASDPELLEAEKGGMNTFLSYPGVMEWWSQNPYAFSTEFRSFVGQLIDDEASAQT